MEEIQQILLDEINSVSKGGDIKKATAICELSAQYIYTARLAVENKRLQTKIANFDEDKKAFMSKDFSNIKNIKVG